MESLYTKYRPQTFADVVGQTHVVTTLQRAVIEGRTSHAYLFCGPRGTGKTTMARLLAKALMCEQGQGHLPDGTCEQCRMIAAGEHPDVYELDAASRTGVDNVREEIISRVSFAPARAAYKMYIIDEVHMLTVAAFNALLKTLEEPPAHVVFVLCTTDPQKIPETILSRVQRFDFHAIGNADIQARLAYICDREGFSYDPEALELVVRHARGGMRDAISELEQLSVSGGGSITVDVARDVLGEVAASTLQRVSLGLANRDVPGLFAQVESLVEVGRDLLQFTRALAGRLRDVYVVAAIGQKSGAVAAATEELPALSREAKAFGSVDRVARALQILSDASTEMRVAPNQRLVLEVALTKIARPQTELTLEALADRVATLERQVAALSAPAARREREAAAGQEAPAKQSATGEERGQRSRQAQGSARSSAAQEAPRQEEAQQQAAARPVQEPSPAEAPKHDAAGATGHAERTTQERSARVEAPRQPDATAWQSRGFGAGQGVAPQQPAAQQPAPQQPSWRPQATPQPASHTYAEATPVAEPHGAPVLANQGPQAATAAQPAPQQGAAVLDAGELQRRWRQVEETLKAIHQPHGALLANSSIVSDDGERLVVSFPKRSSFARNMLSRLDVRTNVDQAIARVFGPRKAVFIEEGTQAAEQVHAALEKAPAQGSSGARAQKTAAGGRDGVAPQGRQQAAAGAGGHEGYGAPAAQVRRESQAASASRGPRTTSAAEAGASARTTSVTPPTPAQGVTYVTPWEPYDAAASATSPAPATASQAPAQRPQAQTQASAPQPAMRPQREAAPAFAAQAQPGPAGSASYNDDWVPYDDYDAAPYEEDYAFGEPEYPIAPPRFSQNRTMAPAAPPAGMPPVVGQAPAVATWQSSSAVMPWDAPQGNAAPQWQAYGQVTSSSAAQGRSQSARQTPQEPVPAESPSSVQPAPQAEAPVPTADASQHGTQAPASAGAAPDTSSGAAAQTASEPPTAQADRAPAPSIQPAGNAAPASAPATPDPAQPEPPAPKKRRTRRAGGIPADIVALMTEVFGEGVTYTALAPDDEVDGATDESAQTDGETEMGDIDAALGAQDGYDAESGFVDEPVDDADYDEDDES